MSKGIGPMSLTKALAYNNGEYENSPVPEAIDLWGDEGLVMMSTHENDADVSLVNKREECVPVRDGRRQARQWNLFV
jgi:hypothetical protein